jgi:branched-chain amino acid transport system permease protein
MVLRPRGLISGRTPSVALGERKEIAAELVAQGRG